MITGITSLLQGTAKKRAAPEQPVSVISTRGDKRDGVDWIHKPAEQKLVNPVNNVPISPQDIFVAEPLTETRELRNISRHIPRPVQFRVLKRENQVCRSCGMPVADDDIHFDHIIPWSKGGPTHEANIQLLCGPCNRKKSDKFEEEFLIRELNDHLSERVGVDILEFSLLVAEIRHDFFRRNNRLPTEDDIAAECNGGEKGEPERRAGEIIRDLEVLLGEPKPTGFQKNIYEALRLRWGYSDGKVRKLRRAAEQGGLPIDQLFEGELELVERLGWRVKDTPAERKKWVKK